MRKSLILLGILVLVTAAAVQGQDFWNPPTLANRNASGFEYYMLEVPASANMVADGYDTDWGWFDPEYVVTQEEWRDEGERPLPTRDDLDVTTKLAWKGAPDNRWYVYMAAHDDTLNHSGTTVARWSGDMIGIQIDYQDHGRTRGNSPCYGQEWVAAPGNVTSNFAYRYPESEGGLGQVSWHAYGQAPWLNGAVRVTPAAAWAADLWTSDTGGDTYYEWNVALVELLDDAGPEVSVPANLDAISGADGRGLPFNFFYEDGDTQAPNNDMTLRGAEGSARQYFAHALLLKVGEYTAQTPTAVEETTWGRIKDSF
ncbi:MAG: hypothetical protein WDA75_17220 [Candidatus Latescibacterota bacterium]|jgi:hypothetical protein